MTDYAIALLVVAIIIAMLFFMANSIFGGSPSAEMRKEHEERQWTRKGIRHTILMREREWMADWEDKCKCRKRTPALPTVTVGEPTQIPAVAGTKMDFLLTEERREFWEQQRYRDAKRKLREADERRRLQELAKHHLSPDAQRAYDNLLERHHGVNRPRQGVFTIDQDELAQRRENRRTHEAHRQYMLERARDYRHVAF